MTELTLEKWKAEFDDKFIFGTKPPRVKLTLHDGLEVKEFIGQLLSLQRAEKDREFREDLERLADLTLKDESKTHNLVEELIARYSPSDRKDI